MARLLVLLAILAGAAWWWTHRGIEAGRVDAFYDAQIAAFKAGDPKRLCDQYADDYRAHEHQISVYGAQDADADKKQSCDAIAALFDFKKKFEAAAPAGSILGTTLNVDFTDVRIASNGKSADVHLKVYMNFGNALETHSEGTEHLVLRRGRLLSGGSDMVTHAEGRLVGVSDPASMAPALARLVH